jgi:Protein of unknown function (DUF2934)
MAQRAPQPARSSAIDQGSGDPSPFSKADEAGAQSPVTREQISLAAYYCAERRGFEPGHELDDWLDAERVLGETAQTLARGVR